MRVRRATLSDAEAIWKVRARAIDGVPARFCTPGQRAAWAAQRTSASYETALAAQSILVRETDDGRLVGFAQLDRTEGIVEACYVDPDFARAGVGRALMAALEREAAALGHARVALEATPNAVAFYERLGYTAQGELLQPLRGGVSLACTLMAKALAPAA